MSSNLTQVIHVTVLFTDHWVSICAHHWFCALLLFVENMLNKLYVSYKLLLLLIFLISSVLLFFQYLTFSLCNSSWKGGTGRTPETVSGSRAAHFYCPGIMIC